MTHARIVLAAALAVTLGTTLATAPAQADEPDVGTKSDGTITYRDPAVLNDATQQVSGTLITTVLEDAGGTTTTGYLIERSDGQLVALDLDADLPVAATGGDVTAKIDPGGSAAAAQVGAMTIEPVAAASPAKKAHRVYLVIDSSVDPSVTTAAVQNAVKQVLSEWTADSNGYITSFSIASTKRVNTSCFTDQPGPADAAWNEARTQFPTVSFSGTSGNHLVLIGVEGCSPFGLGTVGSGLTSGGMVWMQADNEEARLRYVRQVLHHELGHNVGLNHAGRSDGDEYGNLYSVMGFSLASLRVTSLDTVSRDQLRILGACEQLPISLPAGAQTLTGTWYLSSRGATALSRGLKVQDPQGGTLWIDWRAGNGRDAGSFYAGTTSADGLDWPAGLTLQRRTASSNPATNNATTLETSGAGSALDPAVLPGETQNSGGVTVKAGTPAAGLIPITVTLNRPLGTGDASTTPGTVKLTGMYMNGTAKAHVSGYPAGTCRRYQWFRNGVPIAGATTASLKITPARAYAKIQVRVTGSANGYAASNLLVGGGVFRSSTPKVSGKVKVGRTLKVSKGTWKPTPTTWRYRWQLYAHGRWNDIGYATKSTYKIPAKYKGKKLRVKITGSKSGHITANRYSLATAKIKK